VITSVQDWLSLLRDSHSAVGFPLIVCGVALMLFGWRIWKVSVVLAFGVLGMVVGGIVAGPGDDQLTYAAGCGLLLAVLSYWPVQYAIAVLGGVIGAGLTHFYLDRFGLSGAMLWGGVGAVSLACTALAILNRRHVVILVTAFFGAVLVLSGLMTWVMTVPVLFGTFRSMAAWSAIVVPFLVLVPTVMSCFYQMAEMRRLQIEL